MARKTGLLAIGMAIVLFFLAGALTAMITTWLQDWLGISDDGRGKYLVAGLGSLVGFAYWFLVGRLGRKGLKKLITG